MKKLISLVLSAALLSSLAAPAIAAGGYADVPASYWGYAAIQRAGELGLMEGTGGGKFSPDTSMTRAQFIAIAVRAIGKEAEARSYGGESWYSGYITAAEKFGVISKDLFSDDYNKPMTREEMAYVVTNALKLNGESAEQIVPAANIPDLVLCRNYAEQVRFAYSMGVLAGVNDNGDFDPRGTLTRAAGATVAVRLKGELRQTPSFEERKPPSNTPISGKEWVEGEKHGRPMAGDKVTTKSGQTIVLNEKWGIVGVGQDVDIWTGFGPYKVGIIGPDSSTLRKAKYTNEVHSVTEWSKIRANTRKGLPATGTEGQIANDFYEWDSVRSMWNWVGGGDWD